MSFLLLRAPDCDQRKEVISATYKRIIGQENLKELEGGSFWSISGQTCGPVFTLDGDRSEGQSVLKGYTAGSKEPEAGIFEFDNGQQQVKKQLDSGQTRTERACKEQQQVLKESLEDGLECEFVPQFCFLPESSTVCLKDLETELKDLSLQDTKLDTSVSCLEGSISKHVQPPALLEGSSAYVRKGEGRLCQALEDGATLSIESNVGFMKLKSALRGGHEKAGLGPRSKVHVTWAPNVYDPPCTSTSHTSSQIHRRHRHPRSEQKNKHKGKGSSHSDSHKKSQKKMARKSKHPGETFISPTVVSQRAMLNNTLMLKEYVTPLEDLTWKSAKVTPLILPLKGCFFNPVLAFGERDLVTFEKFHGCHARHGQINKLCL